MNGRNVHTRTLVLVGLLVSLVVAGGLSYYASSDPDGLEHVAEQVGFDSAAEEHANADGPLADYQVRGVEDERVSGGLAGVIGALVVLAVAGGLALLLRRRPGPEEQGPDVDADLPDHSRTDGG